MTLISTFDHKPTARDRREFVVLYVLEDALRNDEAIDTSVLAIRVLDALAAVTAEEEAGAGASEHTPAKPRIRVAAIRG